MAFCCSLFYVILAVEGGAKTQIRQITSINIKPDGQDEVDSHVLREIAEEQPTEEKVFADKESGNVRVRVWKKGRIFSLLFYFSFQLLHKPRRLQKNATAHHHLQPNLTILNILHKLLYLLLEKKQLYSMW